MPERAKSGVDAWLWSCYVRGAFRLQRVAGGWKLSRLGGISVWDTSLRKVVKRWRRVNHR